jgi:hypothetical protein
MWVDKHGVSHSVALPEPGGVLDDGLRKRVLGLTDALRRELLDNLDAYEDQIFDDLDAFVASKNEKRFRNKTPPSDVVVVDDPLDGDIAHVFLSQVSTADPRWRLDLYLGSVRYIADLAFPIVTADEQRD